MIHGIIPALAEGGKIKIGGLGKEITSRKGTKFRPPQKLDHFVVTKTSRDAKGDLEIDQAVMAALAKDGDGKVRAIPIVLHSDEIEQVFPTAYALYAGRKLACRGDGEHATRWSFDPKTKQRLDETKELDCPCPYLRATSGPVCKPHGTLHCSIALPGVAIAGAVHTWRTTSIISIRRMLGSLEQIRSLCGTLRGIPLWLKVQPVAVTPPNAPAATVYCCHVELRAADVVAVQEKALKMATMRARLSSGRIPMPLVLPPAGDHESEEEQAEVSQEFYPEDPDGDGPIIDAPVAEIPAERQMPQPKRKSGNGASAAPAAEPQTFADEVDESNRDRILAPSEVAALFQRCEKFGKVKPHVQNWAKKHLGVDPIGGAMTAEQGDQIEEWAQGEQEGEAEATPGGSLPEFEG